MESLTGIFKLLNELRIKEAQAFHAQIKKKFKDQVNSGKSIQLKISDKPIVSIVIVNFNNPELLSECLEKLEKNNRVAKEVIIVDNNSTQKTKEFLSRIKGPQIIYNRKNLHFLHAANQAAKKAKGKYLLFLNTDCFVTLGAIESCVEKIENNSKIGVVGAKVLNMDDSIQEAGSFVLKNGSPYMYGWLRHKDSADFNFDRYVEYVSGSFLLTPVKLFKKLGGFDSKFAPAYFEDTDYCFRVNNGGLRVLYNSQASVYHILKASGVSLERTVKQMHQNQMKFFKRHSRVLKNRPAYDIYTSVRYRSYGKRETFLLVVDSLPKNKNSSITKKINNLNKQGFLVTVLSIRQSKKVTHQNTGISLFVEIVQTNKKEFVAAFLQSRREFFDISEYI